MQYSEPPPRATRVLVVGPKHPGPHSRGGMATVVGLMRSLADPRVRVTTVATYVDHHRAARWTTALLGLARAVLLLAAGRVDVLHVHLAHRGSVVRKSVPLLAARACGVPAVVHAHSYDFAGWFDTLPAIGRAVVRRLLPAARWLVLGEGLVAPYRDRLLLPDAAVRALHNPAPAVTTPPRVRRTGELHVVALGRMGQRKGTYDLLSALQRLEPAARDAVHVVLAGDGEVEEVRDEIRVRGLGPVVDARGWVGPAERDRLLADADLLVLASRAEGLPMAMLEAMAAGVVPVVTDVGAVTEVARHDENAVLVRPGDPPALAAALGDLLADHDRRVRLSAAAQATAAAMGVSAWSAELVELWTGLAAGPAGGRRPR